MKQCPKCKTEHNKPGTFCSRTCANSRVFDESAKLKKSIAMKGKPAVRKDPDSWKENIRRAYLEKYNSTPFNELGSENRKRRVLEEQNNKCNHCGISEWNNNPIVLELEHKDGNTTNNTRENLECICPNCHSQTTTWRGRNNKGRNKPARNGVNEVTDEFLLQCLKETDNIRQGLLKAGIAAKGNNYSRAKRLLGVK